MFKLQHRLRHSAAVTLIVSGLAVLGTSSDGSVTASTQMEPPAVGVRARPVVGDSAPELGAHVEWLRGDSVPSFETGNVYLVDFWATWCLSCVARMPHLSNLAREHASEGLKVLGIAVLQQGSGMSPSAFLDMKPTSMDYAVAQETERGTVPKLVQGPSEEGALPFLYIVDRAGRIAWRSDPLDPYAGLEPALTSVLDGTWDLAQATEKDAHRELMERQAAPLLQALSESSRSGDAVAGERIREELLMLDAELFGHQLAALFQLQAAQDRDVAFENLEGHIERIANNPSALLALARAVAAAAPADSDERSLVVRLATTASELKAGSDPDYDWALAKLVFGVGDSVGAAAAMSRAVASAEGQGWDSSVLSMMRREAARYEAAQ